jgi:hypothetical protein
MPVMGVARFERFFRVAAGVDIDKSDLRRFNDFIDEKLYDLLLIGAATAKANVRDVMEPHDLPITKGLQECVHDFREIEEEVEVEPLLEWLARYPPLDASPSDETESRLPEIAGGLSVALARAFKIIDPEVKNPRTEQWDRVTRIFDLLV